MRYSAQTGCFYPDDIDYPNPPDDLAEVAQSVYEAAMARPQGTGFQIVNGELVIVLPEEETADQARARQWGRIKEARDQKMLTSGVLVDGHWFHSDEPFRNVITQALRLFAIDERADDDPVKQAILPQLTELRNSMWKTMANEFVPASHLLAIKIDAAHAVLVKQCHYRGEVHKATMMVSAAPAQYDTTTGWPAAFGDQ